MKYRLWLVFSFIVTGIPALIFGSAALQVHPAAGLLVVVLIYAIFFYPYYKKQKHWDSLPLLTTYLSKHPNCKHRKGISCFNCNSGSIRNRGVNGANDPRRLHICNHCNTTLYRSETSA